MPDTLIGAGPSLDDLTLGMDTIVYNEAKHYFMDPGTKRLYAKCKIVKTEKGYEVYLTGEAQIGIFRESYNEKKENRNELNI